LVGSTETMGLYGTDSTTGVPYAGAWIWNQTGTCSLAQSGASMPPNSTLLTIEVARTSGSTPVAPGTYPFAAQNGAAGSNGVALFVQFVAYDANCLQTVIEDAQNGIITLDTVSPTAIAGSFDVILSTGGDAGVDHVTGTFYGPVCNFDMNTMGVNEMPDACGGSPGDP
jgi:hypothetical protein